MCTEVLESVRFYKIEEGEAKTTELSEILVDM